MNMERTTVLFFPINAVGHINATLAIADRLKKDHHYRTVFMVLGPTIDSIESHGHELIVIKEKYPYEDYEIDENDDRMVDLDEEQLKKAGKKKKQFPGHLKWPQVALRYQRLFRTQPLMGIIKMLEVFKMVLFGEHVHNYEQIKRAIESLQPDMVFFDNIIPPLCVLEQENTRPWVQLRSANPLALLESNLPEGITPPHYCGAKLYNKQERTRMRQEEPDRWQELLADWKRQNKLLADATWEAQQPMRDHLEKHGCYRLRSGRVGNLIDSPHLNIYLCPKELDYDVDDDLGHYHPRWFRCNSLIRMNGNQNASSELDYWQAELDRGMQGKEELVVFSLGSIASGDEKLVKKYIEMLKDDHKRLYVVSKGINGDNFDLNSSNMIGANYIPQTWFLQRAKLAMIHGGNNGITECMYYGVPMIVLPAFGDQLDNGQRVEDLKLGRRLNLYETSKEELRQTIDELSRDQTTRERIQSIGLEMRDRDDLGKISIMLKKLIDDKRLSQEYIEQCRDKSFREVQANGFSHH